MRRVQQLYVLYVVASSVHFFGGMSVLLYKMGRYHAYRYDSTVCRIIYSSNPFLLYAFVQAILVIDVLEVRTRDGGLVRKLDG